MNSILIATLGSTILCLVVGLFGSNMISGSKGFLKNLFKKTEEDAVEEIKNKVVKSDNIVNNIKDNEIKSDTIKTEIASDVSKANENIKNTENKSDVGILSNQLDKDW